MKMTRWMAAVAGLMIAGRVVVAAALTPAELLQAVEQMTPEEAYTFSESLEKKLWAGVPEGVFTRLAMDISVSGSTLDRVKLDGVALAAGGDLDVEDVGGFEVGLLWQVANPRLRLGVRFSGWSSENDQLGDAGYSRVELIGGEMLAAAQWQWTRSRAWILWTELNAGWGGVTLDTVNTPTGDATTLRSFEGDYALGVILAGATWRFNPTLGLAFSGGYRFAETVDLEEGGRDATPVIDPSGAIGRIGLAVNF